MNTLPDKSRVSRRLFLQSAALAWQQAVADAAGEEHAHRTDRQKTVTSSYHFRLFSPTERQTVMALASRIVPVNERSGGAEAARVDVYIDFVLSNGTPRLQKTWRAALARLGPKVKGRSPSEVDALLSGLATNEIAPTTADEVFFVLLKGAVVDGFYTSREGILRELGYQGDAYLTEFHGCTHRTHTPLPDYVARLCKCSHGD